MFHKSWWSRSHCGYRSLWCESLWPTRTLADTKSDAEIWLNYYVATFRSQPHSKMYLNKGTFLISVQNPGWWNIVQVKTNLPKDQKFIRHKMIYFRNILDDSNAFLTPFGFIAKNWIWWIWCCGFQWPMVVLFWKVWTGSSSGWLYGPQSFPHISACTEYTAPQGPPFAEIAGLHKRSWNHGSVFPSMRPYAILICDEVGFLWYLRHENVDKP